MTEEEKQAQLEAEQTAKEEADAKAKADAEAQDAEFEDSLEGLSDEDKEVKREERKKASDIKKGIDYKAIAEKEALARKKAEDALAKKRFDADKKKREEEEGEEEEVDEDDKPMTKREAKEFFSNTEKKIHSVKISELAKNLAGSDDEAQAIIETHKNRQYPAHLSLEEQLKEAYLSVNSSKIMGENSELKRALLGKDNVNKDGSGTHRDAPESQKDGKKVDGDIGIVLKQRGFIWNTTTKRYENKTDKSGTRYYDPADRRIKLA